MGYGSYTSNDWNKLKASRNINSSSDLRQLYKSTAMKPQYDPKNFEIRESCDSPDNPNSTAIIFGLDVTGSMGYLSESIAKNALNKTMLEIYEKKPVTDPHIMFNAIGDSKTDAAPLQATQFEADIRIAEQLLDIYFEGRGGGNGGESYLLSWYFAATKTKIDCYDKHGRKGFLFTIGDERTHKELTQEEIAKVFGKTDAAYPYVYTAKALYTAASRRYNVFHIVLLGGSAIVQNSASDWKELIGNHAITLDPGKVDMLPQIFVSIMQYTNGMNPQDILKQWDEDAAVVVGSVLNELQNDGGAVEF